MDRKRTKLVAVNQRVTLMVFAEKIKLNLLYKLGHQRSSLALRFGVEMCGLWALMVSECDIKWNNHFRGKAGLCKIWEISPMTGIKRRSLIEMSWPLFRDYHPRNTEEFQDTVLHELAHVMTPGSAHGLLWRAVAIAIGSSGGRCSDLPPARKRTKRDKLLDRANSITEELRQLEKE